MKWLLPLLFVTPAFSAEKVKVEVKEVGRMPASAQEAVGAIRAINQCDLIYRIDDSEKQNVCYVVKSCSTGQGAGVSINCLKQ